MMATRSWREVSLRRIREFSALTLVVWLLWTRGTGGKPSNHDNIKSFWMADKLQSDPGEHVRALWTAKGKQVFEDG
jgi:hypothetical protein